MKTDTSGTRAAADGGGGPEPIDVIFAFDTTGSMASCLAQVKRDVTATVKRLFTEIPGLRVGICCHGDYCDEGSSYVTTWLDLSSDPEKVVEFIRRTGATCGGDAPECYELVLHEARGMAWKSGRAKVLCMIGDDVPHGPEYSGNKKRIDWKNELGLLLEQGVHVYGVQALNRRHATSFWKSIADKTKGIHLTLDQFSDVTSLILAVCYRQKDDEGAALRKFEDELRGSRGTLTRSVDDMLSRLLGRAKAATYEKSDLTAVPPGRFQVLKVGEDTPIKAFVEANEAKFKQGRGFYQFMKPEDVQDYKEIVLEDKISGDLFTGARARELLKLPLNGTVRINPKAGGAEGFHVFIQSTSVNRKLIAGTRFLYEVEDYARPE